MAADDRGKGKPKDGGPREVPFGALHDEQTGRRFPGNTIKTSKYTVLTFLPLNLMEQLQKAANAYFLGISLLMLLGRRTNIFATSVDFTTTLGPLLLMMSASAVIAAADDRRRHISDARTNAQQARVIRMGGKHSVYLDTVTWADIAVGDILVVKGEEDLPADVVPLACSGVDGTCYVSTANLDGETNLKIKSAPSASQVALCGEAAPQPETGEDTEPPLLNQAVERLASLAGCLDAEAPNKSIHTFTGALVLGANKESRNPLCADHLLLRGTQLKNTAWCFGVVAYTGRETRMAKNSSKTPMKLANLERVVNRAMLIVLGTQAALALLSDIMYVTSKPRFEGYWYLFPHGTGRTSVLLPDWLGYWFTFFILYCNLMPISLYAAMEVCNFAQAYFIKHDLGMYDESQDCPALVRSTNLCHELGQISYIFSDKTGTLTQNVMELKRISVGNRIFGTVSPEKGFQGARALNSAMRKEASLAGVVNAFLEVLAVSHTVMVTRDQWGHAKYEAESPDEGALVEAVRDLGWDFRSRAGAALAVHVGRLGTQVYTVLAVNAFTSSRKRMSVVARTPTGELWLLVKGADNVMLERAATQDAKLVDHLTEFAQEGLRTLVLGRRLIPPEEFDAWMVEHEKAQSAMDDRERLLAAAAELLEVRLTIIGATAIEDKLQVGVADTIVSLRNAGIKLWVLTGDKLETARNIGFSTKVLSDDMEIQVFDAAGDATLEELLDELSHMERMCKEASAERREAALMVTNMALERVADLDLGKPFLEVATRCKVVIACRVSPLQKAWMVRLVRKGITPQPVTLSIGDGANDVPMIQEAQVGVGVSGREGRQAVNASDFAIAQFRYLQRLLLVHGRLDYRRTCKFILYSFWKNAVLTLLMFYYTFISGFSGTSMFEGMVWTSFNVVLFWPIIATGVFDRDVEDADAVNFPKLYENGRLGLDLNFAKMVEMLLSALVHSLIVFAVMYMAFVRMDTMHANDYYGFGTSVFTWLVVTMNYRVMFVTTTINVVFVLVWISSFLLYILFLVVYCRIQWLSPWMYDVDTHIVQEPLFWIGLVAVPALAIMVDSFKAYLLQEFLPDRRFLVLETVTLKANEKSLRMRELQSVTAPEIVVGSCAPTPPAEDGVPSTSPGGFLQSSFIGQTASLLPGRQVLRSLSSRRSLVSTAFSAFTFDYPEAGPRKLSFMRHPTAGDTSLMDAPRLQPAMEGAAPDVEAGDAPAECSRRPHGSKFSQQELPAVQNILTVWSLVKSQLLTGTILLILGVFVFAQSRKVAMFEVQYDGKQTRRVGTAAEEMFYAPCTMKGDQPRTCSFTVRVPNDMEPPIALLYEVAPFYQNYFSYQTSVIFSQLSGDLSVDEATINSTCRNEPTRLLVHDDPAKTQQIFPCGLIATSVFNDTIDVFDASELERIPIDSDVADINWESDFRRFQNPPQDKFPNQYPDNSSYSWIFERYPALTDVKQGVRSRRFVDWMFVSFFGHVTNPYGYINSKLQGGQDLIIRIGANFPVEALGAEKRLLFTTRNGLGGRHIVMGYLLLVSSAACYSMAVIAAAIQRQCPRRAGRPRFRALGPRMTMLEVEISPSSRSQVASASTMVTARGRTGSASTAGGDASPPHGGAASSGAAPPAAPYEEFDIPDDEGGRSRPHSAADLQAAGSERADSPLFKQGELLKL